MASTPVPLPFPIQINLGPTMGALLIGVVFGAVFLGITWLQTIFYYRTYPEDTLFLKSLVGVLWVLDTLSLVFFTYGLYTYVITDYSNPQAAMTLVWSVANEPVITSLIALIVHLFLAYRIQVLDRKWRHFSVIVALLSLFPFAFALAAVGISNTQVSSITSSQKLRWCTIAGDVSTSAMDLILAGSTSYLLYRNRNGFARTDRVLNMIVVYVLTSGLVTSTLSTSEMITSLATPNTMYLEIAYVSLSKAYTNTLLAMLNSRRSRVEHSSGFHGAALELKASAKVPQSETSPKSSGEIKVADLAIV